MTKLNYDINNPFADLDEEIIGSGASLPALAPLAVLANPLNQARSIPMFTETCWKCRGTGKWAGYGDCMGDRSCTACQGKGYKAFKTSPAARAKARDGAAARAVKAAETAAQKEAANVEAFKVAKPEVYAWMAKAASTGFEFAESLLGSIAKWGDLTERQLATAERLTAAQAERDAARAAKAVEAKASAPEVNVGRLEAAFAAAKAAKLKWPKITIGDIRISPAGENSTNRGALYVKNRVTDLYLGKVQNGQFFASRDCSASAKEEVTKLLNDPMAYAEAYGKQTGHCCICSRELTDPQSVARGIGPICASKFGW